MKTLLQKNALFSLLVLTLFLYSFGCKEDIENEKILAAKEDSIDLTYHPLPELVGIKQITTFKDSILIDSILPLPACADSIKKNALKALSDSALKLSPDTTTYILGLKIYYGLNDLKTKTRLFYQPVCLLRKSGSGPGSNVEYIPKDSPYYYEYNGSSFTVLTNTTVLGSSRTLYKDHITFKMPNGHFRKFNNQTDSTGDIKGCLFSFQEISAVIKDNKSQYLYILNSGEIFTINSKKYLKHVLILGPDSLLHHVDKIFYRKYGNLSHLCPPSCNTNVFYKIK